MIAAGLEYSQQGEGEAVLFLHGIGGNMNSFNPQLKGIPGFSKIAWNMPGYGKSEAKLWPPTFKTLSDTLSQFITELDLKNVHLVGHSIGGMLALEHAIRQPSQVSSLTLIGTTPSFGGRDETFKEQFLKARLAPLEAGQTMAEIAAKAAPHLVGPKTNPGTIQAIETQFAGVSEKTWRGILECLVTFNQRDNLVNIQIPCCVIAGECDDNAPVRTMEKMATSLPNSEFHLLTSVGHMINQEAAEETNTIISQFLEKIKHD